MGSLLVRIGYLDQSSLAPGSADRLHARGEVLLTEAVGNRDTGYTADVPSRKQRKALPAGKIAGVAGLAIMDA